MIDETSQDDWFASNQPPQDQADPNSGILRSIAPTQIPGQSGYSGDTGIIGPNRSQSGFSGNVEDLWNQYRSNHPDFHPTQGANMSLSPFVEWARSQGANISIAGPASGGYVKGITDQNGQFVKLLNGSDQPIWLPGGDALGGGGNRNPYSYQSFDQSFSFPTWDKTFTAPTLDQAKAEPGYQFVQQQGEQGILNNAAKMGIARTGGTLKDLSQFNTGLADTTYQNVYGRAADQYNKELNSYLTKFGLARSTYDAALQKYGVNQGNFYQGIGTEQGAQNQAFNQQYSLASLGLNAANAGAGLYANQGNNIANIYGTSAANQGNYTTQVGNANAAGTVGAANAWGNAFGNIGNDLSSIYANQGRGIYRKPNAPYAGQMV